jgi:hypothetical protein
MLRLRLGTSSSYADDACRDQLLNLRSNARVLHVFLKRSWVVLRLLEDTLHDRILHDAQDLESISHLSIPNLRLNSPRDLSESAPWSAPPSRSP